MGVWLHEVMTTVIGIVIGAAVTWFVAHVYYKRAGDALRLEAAELRKLLSMILTAMERQGWARLNRDSAGEVIGFVFEFVGGGGVRVGGSAKTEFVPAKPNDKVAGDRGT